MALLALAKVYGRNLEKKKLTLSMLFTFRLVSRACRTFAYYTETKREKKNYVLIIMNW